jgi:hypothetical protein
LKDNGAPRLRTLTLTLMLMQLVVVAVVDVETLMQLVVDVQEDCHQVQTGVAMMAVVTLMYVYPLSGH